MYKTALLIVTKPLHQVTGRVPAYLSEINRLVSNTVYIHIQPRTESRVPDYASKYKISGIPFTSEIRNLVKEFYTSSANTCSNINIRVLLGNFSNASCDFKKYDFSNACDIVLIDEPIADDVRIEFMCAVGSQFNIHSGALLQDIDFGLNKDNEVDEPQKLETSESTIIQQHTDTVLGGTFDRLHTGHKLLLTEGCCLATNSLTVGVTDGDMNKKKTLCEMIEPVETRINVLRHFLQEVKPSLSYTLVPITDMFGPTITEPELNLIVLSQEVKKGGEIINTEREKKGMRRLHEYTIDLVEDSCHGEYEEEKVSSSSLRKRLLGTLYQPVKVGVKVTDRPYIIGLTGGIASGKSSICLRLEGLGAVVVDCDKLGHKAYVKGSRGFDNVVAGFGPDVVGSDGAVDRKILGSKVFSDKSELTKLNNIVWPEIADLAKQQIHDYTKAGHNIIILDAAILLEAGWDSMVHEVWTSIIPPAEAVKRIVERNNLSEDQATQRIQSQISNTERVGRSNVILSTLWMYEYTQTQVEKAWHLLLQRIQLQEKVIKSSNM